MHVTSCCFSSHFLFFVSCVYWRTFVEGCERRPLFLLCDVVLGTALSILFCVMLWLAPSRAVGWHMLAITT